MPNRKKINSKVEYLTLRNISKVVRFLTISDFMIISSFGLITPIFAIFITESIEGGNVQVAGISWALYLLSKSLGQIPIATIIDRIKGEKDDFWAMLIGSLIFSLVPILYIFINQSWELYIVQIVYGLAVSAVVPSWRAIFTRHIDKEHEGVEWGVYQTMIDLGSAATASIGGFLAASFGFAPLFLVVSLFSIIGSLFLLGVYKDMIPGLILSKK